MTVAEPTTAPHRANFYQRIPLPVPILAALFVGLIVGVLLPARHAEHLRLVSDLVLLLLGVLATPLIFLSVVRSLTRVDLAGRKSLVLFAQLMFNTVVAIL